MRVELPCGLSVECDDQDAELVQGHNWRPMKKVNGELVLYSYFKHGRIYLHRQILKVGQDKQVSFIDGNFCNVRRDNLRVQNRTVDKVRYQTSKGILTPEQVIKKYIPDHGKRVQRLATETGRPLYDCAMEVIQAIPDGEWKYRLTRLNRGLSAA